uniref:RRM domain-containing protein n=1 Tax=Alexandrium monilatum TaxID=311494 RepID=A0A7S4R3Q4_9DINO
MGWGGSGKGFEFTVQHPDRTVWLGNLPEGTTHTDLMPMMKTVGDCRRVQVGRKGTGFAFFSNPNEAKAAIEQLNGSVVNGTAIQVDTYTSKTPGGGSGGKGGGWGEKGNKGAAGVWKPQFQKIQPVGKGWGKGGSSWGKGGDDWGCGNGWGYKGGDSWGSKGGWGGGKGGGKGKKFDFKVAHPDRTVWIGNIAQGTTHEDLMPLFKTVGDCKRVQVGTKGTGFAFFADEAAAQAAITQLNGSSVNGQEIQVDVYTKK